MAIIEKGGYGSIKDSGGRASGNWKGMSGINGFRWYEGDGRKQKAPSSYQILPGDHFRFCTSDPGRKSDPYASLGNQGPEGERALRMHFLRQLQQPA